MKRDRAIRCFLVRLSASDTRKWSVGSGYRKIAVFPFFEEFFQCFDEELFDVLLGRE
jgi:hypothetical protein